VHKRAFLGNAWRGGLMTVVCGLAMAANSALAQPVFQNAYVDTQKNTQLWAWVDDYVVSSDYGLNYESFAISNSAAHGSVSYDPYWGLITYVPDEDYEGYDGFTFTMEDELGNPSNLVHVFVYVEPEGTITNLAPVIVGLHVELIEGDYFAVNGYVLDDQDSYGREVIFGGYLQGQTMTIGYDGQFSYLVYVPRGTGGDVTVHYVDPYNVSSESYVTCINNLY